MVIVTVESYTVYRVNAICSSQQPCEVGMMMMISILIEIGE